MVFSVKSVFGVTHDQMRKETHANTHGTHIHAKQTFGFTLSNPLESSKTGLDYSHTK